MAYSLSTQLVCDKYTIFNFRDLIILLKLALTKIEIMSDHLENNDQEENLRMENEILRLKLMAELGGETHSMADIDPEIENQFLKQVLAFEHGYANAKRTTVYESLGKPDFKKPAEISDELIGPELQAITALLLKSNIEVDFLAEYDDRTKYAFITEELFDHEANGFMVPGMTMHYIYEEFHPNHKLDIENRATEFLSHWFKQTLNEHSWELAPHFILPDRIILPKNEVIAKIKNIFDAYTEFIHEKYEINDVGFQLDENGGLGHAGGFAGYVGVLENGENRVFVDPFKLYMEFDGGSWHIFYAVFPGLVY
jgi:hypothetical protein